MAPDLLQTLAPPAHWRDRACWRVLEVGFAGGRQFLDLWQAWRNDPQRPRLLHHVAIEPNPSALLATAHPQAADAAVSSPDSASPAALLAARCWGLTPGFHRFTFDEGRVLLTLCVGAIDVMLREQRFDADSIWLGDDAIPAWIARDGHAAKALARRCRRGTQLGARWSTLPPGWRAALAASGFMAAAEPSADGFRATFDPGWTPRRRQDPAAFASSERLTTALVIGAGIAGSAVAASLARRGLQVQVLDAQAMPAQGASGLPAGLLVPHLSADDCIRSRLSRVGLRSAIEFARERLEPGRDWQLSGVLEVRPDALRALSGTGTDAAGRDWSTLASAAQKSAAGLDDAASAVWHPSGGWLHPAALVRALLDDPQIGFVGNTVVHALRPAAGGWCALRADGSVAAQAPLVVLAAGHASARLAAHAALPLQAVRGQVSFGRHEDAADNPGAAGNGGRKDDHGSHSGNSGGSSSSTGNPSQLRTLLPPFPVNGHGSLLPHVALGDGTHGWVFGASYRPGDEGTDWRAEEHRENLERLNELLPRLAQHTARSLRKTPRQGWAGVRAVAPDRLPLVGPLPLAGLAVDADAVSTSARPGPAALPVWVCTALGSRGLGQAICCAELLAGRLFGEPLAVEPALAKATDVRRYCG